MRLSTGKSVGGRILVRASQTRACSDAGSRVKAGVMIVETRKRSFGELFARRASPELATLARFIVSAFHRFIIQVTK
jgi:hypothetical protein